MSKWFSGLKDLTQDFSDKFQAAIPIDKETLQKLTLSTPEMKAERAQYHEEYKHKVAVKDSLAHLYPWETRDPERDILVEECKEAIMALSADTDTFFGPYQMPHLKVNTEEEEEERTEEEVLLAEAEGAPEEVKEVKDKDPTSEALEKLQKLEPLPPLLANFDLDAHVGLIQKMLKVDPTLVARQSSLSGKCLSVLACRFLLGASSWYMRSKLTFCFSRHFVLICRRRSTRKGILAQLLFPLCLYKIRSWSFD
jgi:hypothetical protein